MNRTILTFVFACFALAMAAQTDAIKVKYSGNKPTISDFAWAYLTHETASSTDDNCDAVNEPARAMKQAWICYQKGTAQYKGVTLSVDQKNGFVVFESKQDDHILKVEMCYWNEADGKHKLFACNVQSFTTDGKPNPGQFDGLTFYRYTNATKKMDYSFNMGYDTVLGDNATGSEMLTFALPRSGKNITATIWPQKGKQRTVILKWNGHKFKK